MFIRSLSDFKGIPSSVPQCQTGARRWRPCFVSCFVYSWHLSYPKFQHTEIRDIIVLTIQGNEAIKDKDIGTMVLCSSGTLRYARSNLLQHGTIDVPKKNLGRPRVVTPNVVVSHMNISIVFRYDFAAFEWFATSLNGSGQEKISQPSSIYRIFSSGLNFKLIAPPGKPT